MIRVPVKTDRQELKMLANEILKDTEDLYESAGVTFVLEKRGRSDFYRSFGTLKLCRRFHLNVDQARRVRRRAYARWNRWFRECEEKTLKLLGALDGGEDRKRRYLEVRSQLRRGEDPRDVDINIIEQAGISIRSVKWR